MDTNDAERVQLAVGSVVGARHRRLGRPNQDAAATLRSPHGLALAVCDGCGSGARSEIGAALGARLWTVAIAERLADGGALTAADFDALATAVLARLATVADLLGADRAQVTRDHLLFTSVCAAITDDQVAVVAIGDGVVGLGDDVHVLGPFEDNAPPYLTEAWFGVTRAPVVWLRARGELDRLVLATDGAAPLVGDALTALGASDTTFSNRAALTRRLTLLAEDQVDIDWEQHRTARRAALLDDDTTLVLARWSPS